MKAIFFLIFGILVFPSMYKLRGAAKAYTDMIATIGTIGCTGYGIYLLF